MLGGLERVIEAHDTLVIRLLQDGELLHHLLFFGVFASLRYGYLRILVGLGALQEFFVNRFDGDQLLTHLMRGQVHFAEGAPAQDTADPIEL